MPGEFPLLRSQFAGVFHNKSAPLAPVQVYVSCADAVRLQPMRIRRAKSRLSRGFIGVMSFHHGLAEYAVINLNIGLMSDH